MIWIFLLLFNCSAFYCQSSQNSAKTNLEIFEENISSQLEKYFYYPGLDRDFQFVFMVNPSQGGGDKKPGESEIKFINSLIKKTAESNKLKFSFLKNPEELRLDSSYNLIVIQVYNLETKYTGFKKNKFLGEKTLIRNIKIKIGIEINSNDKKFTLSDYILSDYKDEINLDDYETLEASQYEFTKGIVPEVGVFERIIFPVILITASAAAIILFFSIRSK
ncbi:MAG: hypothetical protein ACRDFC_02685 [Ignavibacteria bacterium]